MLSLLVGFVSVFYQWRRAEVHLEESRQAHHRAEESFREARDAVDRFYVNVSENKLLAAPGLQPLRKQLLNDALRYYRNFLRQRADDPALTFELAETYFKVARIYRALGDRAEGLAADQQARALYQQLADAHPDEPKYPLNLAISLSYLASYASEQSDHEEAIRQIETARAIWERLVDTYPDNPAYNGNLGSCYNQLAGLTNAAGRTESAREWYKKARQIWERLAEQEPRIFEYQDNLARLYVNYSELLGVTDPTEALRLLEQASRVWDKRLAADPRAWQRSYPSALALAYGRIGEIHRTARRWDEALTAYEKERTIFERLIKDNPLVPTHKRHGAATWNVIAIVQMEKRQFPSAKSSLNEAKRLQGQVLTAKQHAPDHFDLMARIHANLGLVDLELRQPNEARESFTKAIEHARIAVKNAPRVPQYRTTLGVAVLDLGRTQRLIERFDEAMVSLRESRQYVGNLPNRWLEIAREMAQCVPHIEKTEGERVAKEAIDALREAIRLGLRETSNLRDDPALGALRDREEFRKLLADHEGK
jgi:tetratricopeptide (TPR) repeat protein